MSARKEYQDAEGRTYLLSEEDAKAGDFKPVKQAKAPENKQVTPKNKQASSIKADDDK